MIAMSFNFVYDSAKQISGNDPVGQMELYTLRRKMQLRLLFKKVDVLILTSMNGLYVELRSESFN